MGQDRGISGIDNIQLQFALFSLPGRRLCHDLLHPAHLAVLQPNFDAVRMHGGIGQ